MKLKYNDSPKVSSSLNSIDLFQNPRPLIIGERLNSQGSKKAKQMVLADDFDGLIEVARYQVEDGAHCIDVCVATTERSDEKSFMQKLVKRLSLEIEAPLVIDSTDSAVVATALRQIPGVPIINSINLEGDGSRFTDISPLMAKYGAPAISMCIGPNGMAKTSQEKVDVARLIYSKSLERGLKPWQLIFDVLTFTLATGEEEYIDSASETLKGIKFVKETFPKSLTTLGLSNVSFGLPQLARKFLNSVFLYHAIKNGLDSVIINPKDIIPYPQINSSEKSKCEDLIFNTHGNALSELISYFTNKDNGQSSVGQTIKASNSMEIDPAWNADKRCYFRIVNRMKEGIENDVALSIASKKILEAQVKIVNTDINGMEKMELIGDKEKLHQAAVETLNEVLLPAMKEVGDKFGAGELILPFVLKSAECMKSAVAELERYLIKQEGISKGKLVLCTVYGDVHDIGKNLVKTIFVNNGYEVYDLGKQVPIPTIINKIKEVKADAVGLSALLVSTSKQMQLFSDFVRENKIEVPVLCGGAAINSDYINRIARGVGKQEIYRPGIFYCKTAFEGLKVMNSLMGDQREQFLNTWLEKLSKWKEKIYENSKSEEAQQMTSDVKPISNKPTPPSYNNIYRFNNKQLDLSKIWEYLNKKSLFVLSWGVRGKTAAELKEDFDALLEEWKLKVIQEDLFDPQAVYGYFKCRKVGNNDLLVQYINENGETGEIKFEFPRSSNQQHLCLSDYFDSESDDVVAFQSVTMGQKVARLIEEWNHQGRYTDAYYLHGLAVESTEALADMINFRIKEELNLKESGGGLRYSWGYPSCPDITQHFMVWKLINPSLNGMTLTESGQIDPEFSTAAIVVHHPKAQYFTL
jgi:5-methyltetrahydrofolate--homocysteine methyltransferase